MFKEIGHISQGLHLSFAFGYNSIIIGLYLDNYSWTTRFGTSRSITQ